ncbi:beta strand repeat-containing protein [Niveibacterium sp. 24ML]|uniref:beta strand repeat-containing protein n=1 Tax=Niveibacterium sp. 24ML TaxID=2985512 RepID=UPI00226F76E7|nr:hypothetical protein [Niveibacterium sp. 24ML]
MLGGVGTNTPLASLNNVSSGFVSTSPIVSSGAVGISGTTADLKGVSAGGPLLIAATTTLSGTYTTSNGNIEVTGSSLLNGDTTFIASTGKIRLAGAVDGAHAIVTKSDAGTEFAGALGATTRLSSVYVSGATQAGNISTTGTITLDGSSVLAGHYDTAGGAFLASGPSILVSDTRVATGNGSITFAARVDGAHALTTTSTSASQFMDKVGATNALTSLTVSGPAKLANVRANGGITLNGAVTLGGTYVTQNGPFALNGPVVIASNSSVSAGSGTVRFEDTVDGPGALSVQSNGGTTFAKSIGGTTALASLSVSGPSILHGAHTVGNQTFSGSTTLSGSLASDAGTISTTGALLLAGDTSVLGKTVTFDATVDGAHKLAINASDTATLAGAVGSTEAPTSLSTSAARIDLNAGTVKTIGAQDWQGPMWIGKDVSLSSISGQAIAFSNRINSANASSLEVNTAGITQFSGAIGVDGALGALGTDVTGQAGETTRLDFITSSGEPNIRVTGDIRINDVLVNTGALSLVAGGSIDAQNAGNTLTGNETAVTMDAGSAKLFSTGAIVLRDVRLANGGEIRAGGVLSLTGNLVLNGGQLGLVSDATSTVLASYSDPELNAAIKTAGLDLYRFGAATLPELSAVIEQSANSKVSTAANSLLWLRAPGGGSLNLASALNDIQGGISAVSGSASGPSRFDSTAASTPVGFVRLSSSQLHIAGSPVTGTQAPASGVLGDAIKLTSARLDTGPDGLISARTPYVDAQGVPTSLPGVVFDILPTALDTQGFGTPAPNDWIRLRVGDGSRGGFVTLNPKGAFRPDFAVFAGGTTQVIPFYDGTNVPTEIQIYYNGALPQAANLVGALTAVSAVGEEARRLKIDEAVRTENVTRRLRAGVISEVGPGRPATNDAEGAARPDVCEPDPSSLACVQVALAPHREDVAPRVRKKLIVEVGPARAATTDTEGAARVEACTPDAQSLSCK